MPNLPLPDTHQDPGTCPTCIQSAQRALALNETQNVHLALAFAYINIKDAARGREHVEAAEKLSLEKNHPCHRDLALMYYMLGDYEQAVQHSRLHLQLNPGDVT